MIEKILDELEEEREIAYADFDKYASGYELDLDDTYDDFFHKGLARAKKIVQEVAKEYGNASDNDLAVVSALPSLYTLQKFEKEAIHKVVASVKGDGWIPVEQILPPTGERVQVTYKGKMTGNLLCDAMAYIAPDKSWHWDGVEGSKSHVDTEITAWKNPGAPYQKGESNE